MKYPSIDFYGLRKVYFGISLALIAIMLVGAVVFGVELDIQFKGGALITYAYEGDIDKAAFQSEMERILARGVSVQESTDIATGARTSWYRWPRARNRRRETARAVAGPREEFGTNNLKTVSHQCGHPTIGRSSCRRASWPSPSRRC
jgi:preprotein translocase subunit SecF